MHFKRTPDREAPQVDEATKLRLLKMSQAYLASVAQHESAAAEDAAAWRSFCEVHDPTIRHFVARFHVRRQDFEDCVQEVWAEVAKRLRTFEYDPNRGQFESWLYRLVCCKVANLRRQRSRHPAEDLSDDAESEASIHAWAESRADEQRRAHESALKVAIAQLREVSTTLSYCVFQMRSLEGCPVERVADALHLSTDQVRWRNCRMKQRLRELLEPGSTDGLEPDA